MRPFSVLSRPRWVRNVAATLLLGASPFAFGQDPLGGEIDGGFALTAVAPTYLSVRLPQFDGGQAWLLGRRRTGVVTHRAGETTERYVVGSLVGGFNVPLRLGGRRASVEAQGLGSWLDARVSEGDVPARFETGEIALAVEAAPRVTVALSARDRFDRADYSGPLVSSALTTIGRDPDLDVRVRERALGLAATGRFGANTVGLGIGGARIGASLTAVGDLDRLRLPLDVSGTDVALRYDRTLSPASSVTLDVRSRALSGDGEVARGGREIGIGGANLHSTSVTLARTDRYANGGLLRYGIESSGSRFTASGIVPDAREIRPDVPIGTSVRYNARIQARRTELAVRWEIPQRRGRLGLAYRHALVDAEASAGYDASLFLLGYGDRVRERLDRTAVGIFGVEYGRRAGAYDLDLGLEQIVPYRFGSGNNGGGGGGTDGGVSSRSEGGWAFSLRIGRRF